MSASAAGFFVYLDMGTFLLEGRHNAFLSESQYALSGAQKENTRQYLRRLKHL